MNRHTFIGNIGRDAETKTIPSGNSVTTFSVAVSEKYKDKNGETKEITTWVKCEIWGERGSKLSQYIKKGNKIYVEGRPMAEAWTNPQGDLRSGLKCKVDNIEFMSGGRDRQQTAPIQNTPSPTIEDYNSDNQGDDMPF